MWLLLAIIKYTFIFELRADCALPLSSHAWGTCLFAQPVVAFSKMVVKTDVCFFTELRIFPGHGRRVVRKDGKLLAFISYKARSLYIQRKKAQVLRWTQSWRRHNKKTRLESLSKKRSRRTVRVFKSVQGISVDDLRRRRDAKPEVKKTESEAHIKELKEKQKHAAEQKKKAAAYNKGIKLAAGASSTFNKIPKFRRVQPNIVVGGKK